MVLGWDWGDLSSSRIYPEANMTPQRDKNFWKLEGVSGSARNIKRPPSRRAVSVSFLSGDVRCVRRRRAPRRFLRLFDGDTGAQGQQDPLAPGKKT